MGNRVGQSDHLDDLVPGTLYKHIHNLGVIAHTSGQGHLYRRQSTVVTRCDGSNVNDKAIVVFLI